MQKQLMQDQFQYFIQTAAKCVMVGEGLNSIENGMLPIFLKYRKRKL